jgi:hypothetical protein
MLLLYRYLATVSGAPAIGLLEGTISIVSAALWLLPLQLQVVHPLFLFVVVVLQLGSWRISSTRFP